MGDPLIELAERVWKGAKDEAQPLRGGPVELGLEELVLPFRLAWFCDEEVHPALEVELPSGADWSPGPAEGAALAVLGDRIRVGFVAPSALRGSGALLRGLPDGARVELATADLVTPTDTAGNHRYAGRVAAGKIELTHAWPRLESNTLAEALDLARTTEGEGPFRAFNEAEATAVLHDAEQDPLEEEGWVTRKGLFLGATDEKRGQLAALVFRHRFRGAFDVEEAERLDHEVRDQVGRMDAAVTALADLLDGRDPGREPLLIGRSGTFWRTDLSRRAGPDPARLEALERDARGLGFDALLGDVEHGRAPGVVHRGLAHARGDYALIVCPGDSRPHLALFTALKGGAWLITTQAPIRWEWLDRGVLRTSLPPATPHELERAHATRLGSLGIARVGPSPSLSLELLAREMDQVLTRLDAKAM